MKHIRAYARYRICLYNLREFCAMVPRSIRIWLHNLREFWGLPPRCNSGARELRELKEIVLYERLRAINEAERLIVLEEKLAEVIGYLHRQQEDKDAG